MGSESTFTSKPFISQPFTSPTILTGKAKNLNDKFYLLLNEIVKTYPSSKFNADPVSSTLHTENMARILVLQNDYFLYKNEVVDASEKIQYNIAVVDEHINVLEGQNKVLSLELDNLKNSSYSAEGLFDDAQITRNELLVSNFILFATICGGGFMYYKSIAQ